MDRDELDALVTADDRAERQDLLRRVTAAQELLRQLQAVLDGLELELHDAWEPERYEQSPDSGQWWRVLRIAGGEASAARGGAQDPATGRGKGAP